MLFLAAALYVDSDKQIIHIWSRRR